MKRYNISEVAKMFGISSESLRNYERRGLISPVRTETGYRTYTQADIYILSSICVMRNAGYSFKEIERFAGADYEEAVALRRERFRQAEEELAYQRLKLDALQKQYEELDMLRYDDGRVVWTQSPAMLRVNNQVNDAFFGDEGIVRWAQHLPIVSISPAFSREAVVDRRKEIQFGYAVPLDVARRLGLDGTPGAEIKPSERCLTAVVHSRGKRYLSAASLAHIAEHCEANGLAITGEVWGTTICKFIEAGEHARYHRVYVPVCPAEEYEAAD